MALIQMTIISKSFIIFQFKNNESEKNNKNKNNESDLKPHDDQVFNLIILIINMLIVVLCNLYFCF